MFHNRKGPLLWGARFSAALILLCSLASCKGISASNGVEDASLSGVAAGSVGGALGGSSPAGTLSWNDAVPASGSSPWRRLFDLLPSAWAAAPCPTLLSQTGAGCTSGSGFADLTFNRCSFGSSRATWDAILEYRGNGIACGSFLTTGTITSQFVNLVGGGGTPSTGTRVSSFGTNVVIDHLSVNLQNYQNDSITPLFGGGYGVSVSWAGGVRNSLTVRQHVFGIFDYSVSGTLAVQELSGATSRTVSGNLTTYHNKSLVMGTTSFNNVVYEDGCCLPISGNVTTLFGATSLSLSEGEALNGKSEVLTFTGCGSASLQSTAGITQAVTLSHCL